MQISWAKLSVQECDHHHQGNLCFYCGNKGHCKRLLSKRRGSPVLLGDLESQSICLSSPSWPKLTVLVFDTKSQFLLVFIDSGEDLEFIDVATIKKFRIPVEQIEELICAKAIDDQPLLKITHHTKDLHIIMSGNYHEDTSFYVVCSSKLPIILGYTRLCRHQPHIEYISSSACAGIFFFCGRMGHCVHVSTTGAERHDWLKLSTPINLHSFWDAARGTSLIYRMPITWWRLKKEMSGKWPLLHRMDSTSIWLCLSC